MATIHINKGHNLKLAGSPKKEVKSLSCPKKIKIIPDNFPGVKPKMQITTNDQVKIGSKLFFDKNNPEVHFCSPVSGKIIDIKLGNRRKVESIEISCENNDYNYDRSLISKENISRDEIIEKLL